MIQAKSFCDMYQEHAVILKLWVVLGKMLMAARSGSAMNFSHLKDMIEIIRHYIDGCHHAKEELHLFPWLETKNLVTDAGLIPVLLEEHEQARKLVDEISVTMGKKDSASCDHVISRYRRLLFRHIGKENPFFHKMENEISPDEDRELFSRFKDLEDGTVGFNAKKEILKTLEGIEQAYRNVKVDPNLYHSPANLS